MTDIVSEGPTEESAVVRYKRIFRAVLDKRPSGVRLRLARTIGKNRSFISQISNPAYPIPIPAQHVPTILEVCHFSPAEKEAFLEAYGRAHPGHVVRVSEAPSERALTLSVPDLGSAKQNAQLDAMLTDFARRLAKLLNEKK
jgi:hypothetical protein